ncbi:MAG: transglycosylase domain-containing protein [Butyrivibrio sp.]
MNYSSESIIAKQKSLASHKKRMGTKILTYMFRFFIILCIFGGVSVICMGAGSVKAIIETAPEITLNDVTPSQYKTTIYDCNGIAVETLVASGANRIYVTINEIPEHMKNAFIAIEDEHFYEHNGIDAKGIIRAAYIGVTNNFRFTQGASTITQQLIKNNVFSVENEKGNSDRIRRKIQEQYLALKLEEEVNDKDIILENYLNTINLSNNNLGVQSASINYFNKDVSELTLSECAVIAATTSNPYRYDPIRRPENNAIRRKLVLDKMLEQGMITQMEYDEALADNVYDRIMNNNISSESNAYSYYNDALVQQIMEDLMTQKGYTYTQAYNVVYRGGLSIFSCEDSNIQKIVEETANDPSYWNNYLYYSVSFRIQVKLDDGSLITFNDTSLVKYLKQKYNSDFINSFSSKEEAQAYIDEYKAYILEDTGGTFINGSETVTFTMEPQIALTVIENGTGCVRAILGGRGEKTQSLILNRATGTKRQAGSTFKPLAVYAPAIDVAGYAPGTVVNDEPYYYETGQVVHNADEIYRGYVTLRQALAESRNVPAIEVLSDIGVSTGLNYAQKFGISTITENDYYLPVALGTCSVTNYEMTAAYTTFANNGQYVEPKLYTKVLDHSGNVILDNTATNSTQVIKESTAFLITDMLHSVITDGTLKGVGLDDKFYAAKSGTTQNNNDKWVIGFSSKYTVGTWCGFDDNREYDTDRTVGYLYIWADVLKQINEGIDSPAPKVPDDIIQVPICKDSGLLAVEGLCDCDPRGSRVYEEYFVRGKEPSTACNIHMKVTICKASDLIACEDCPEGYKKTVIRIYKNVPDFDLEEYEVIDRKYAVTDEDLKNTCDKHNKR